MRAEWAAVVALLILAQPATAAPSTPLGAGFRVPAQAEGQLDLAGLQWALFVFGPSDRRPVQLDVDVPLGGTATTWTYLQYALTGPARQTDAHRVGSSRADLAAGTHATVTFAGGQWSSLFMVADIIDLHGQQVQGTLGRTDADAPVQTLLPPVRIAAGTIRPDSPSVPTLSASMALLGAAPQDVDLRFEAHGLHRLEWYNATVDCSTAGCPAGPAYDTVALPVIGGDRIEVRNYTEFATPAGSAAGAAHVLAAVVGGGRIDVSVAGSLRLPAIILDPCATPCMAPGQATLRAEGNVTLTGLGPEPGAADRLRGQLGGTTLHARVDETPRPDLVRAAALAGGAALGLAVLAKAALALFLRRADALRPDHPRRVELERVVFAEPGLTFRQLQRRVGWANGVTRHHLHQLVAAGRLAARPHGNTVRYFENHGRYDGHWRQVVEARDPGQNWLLGWIARASGGVSQAEAVRAAAAHRGWSRAATQRRLRALASAGLVQGVRQGKLVLYEARPALAAFTAPGGSPAPPILRPVPVATQAPAHPA